MAGFLCLAAPVAGEYLCTVGPAPLRWRLPVPARPDLLRSLPPLSTGREEAAKENSDETGPVLGPPAPANARSESGAAAPTAAIGTNDVSAALNQVVPSDLINALFYRPSGTNATSVVVPLNFVPPPMNAPRSSSATYSNDKP